MTTSLDELAHLVHEADRRVVLLGGDGSVHAFANVDGPKPEVALLPAGRANNIAHSLSIPIDLAAAARVAVAGGVGPLDLIAATANGADRARARGRQRRLPLRRALRLPRGQLGRLPRGIEAAASTLARFEPGPVLVESDGAAELSSLNQLFVVNFPCSPSGSGRARRRPGRRAARPRRRRGVEPRRARREPRSACAAAPTSGAADPDVARTRSPRLDRRPLAGRRRHHHHRLRPRRDPPRAGRLLDREARTVTAVAATVDVAARPSPRRSRSSRSSRSPRPRPGPASHAPSRRRTCRCCSTDQGRARAHRHRHARQRDRGLRRAARRRRLERPRRGPRAGAPPSSSAAASSARAASSRWPRARRAPTSC